MLRSPNFAKIREINANLRQHRITQSGRHARLFRITSRPRRCWAKPDKRMRTWRLAVSVANSFWDKNGKDTAHRAKIQFDPKIPRSQKIQFSAEVQKRIEREFSTRPPPCALPRTRRGDVLVFGAWSCIHRLIGNVMPSAASLVVWRYRTMFQSLQTRKPPPPPQLRLSHAAGST